jgi:hypothetical protein
MTLYFNNNPSSQLYCAEVTDKGDHAYGLLYTRDGNDAARIISSLQANHPDIHVISNTKQALTEDHVIALRTNDATGQSLIDAINEQGESLTLPPPEKAKFNPWKYRGITSLVGQSFQIASAFTNNSAGAVNPANDRAAAVSIGTFGILNFTASLFNLTFGGQHNKDSHQLMFLKEQFNHAITPHVEDPSKLPPVHGYVLQKRADEMPDPTLGQRLYNTAQKYSVSVGEITLRSLGTLALITPPTRVVEAVKECYGGTMSLPAALRHCIQPDERTLIGGLGTLSGKIVSLLAKEKDLYTIENKSWMQTFREDFAFRLSSLLEGSSSVYMMSDRMNWLGATDKRSIKIDAIDYEGDDFLGGLGNAVFISGYAIRLAAPFGSLEVPMDELYAHISDGLALLPKEKIPEMLAQTVTDLHQHFDKKAISTSEMYANIADDLKRHYDIDILELQAKNTIKPFSTPTTSPNSEVKHVQHDTRLLVPTLEHAGIGS